MLSKNINMKWVTTWHDIQFLNNMYNLTHINEHSIWFLNDMYHLTCYTFSSTSTKQNTLYIKTDIKKTTNSLDQFFYQVLIQSTFNKKNKYNTNDDNDDNHVQDGLASNQHQLLVPKGVNCTPRYQVKLCLCTRNAHHAQAMEQTQYSGSYLNTSLPEKNPDGCDVIHTNIIIFPSKRWKVLKLKVYLSTRSYFH